MDEAFTAERITADAPSIQDEDIQRRSMNLGTALYCSLLQAVEACANPDERRE